jgi:hypothetical protein
MPFLKLTGSRLQRTLGLNQEDIPAEWYGPGCLYLEIPGVTGYISYFDINEQKTIRCNPMPVTPKIPIKIHKTIDVVINPVLYSEDMIPCPQRLEPGEEHLLKFETSAPVSEDVWAFRIYVPDNRIMMTESIR